MKATILVLLLLLAALATTGAVQAYRYFHERYLEFAMLWRELTHFLKRHKEEQRKREAAQSVIIRFEKPSLGDRALHKVGISDATTQRQDIPAEELPPADELFITVENGGETYSLTENVSVSELQQLSQTLVADDMPIAQEIKSAHTLRKLYNSPMMAHLLGTYEERIKEVLSNALVHEAKAHQAVFNSQHTTN